MHCTSQTSASISVRYLWWSEDDVGFIWIDQWIHVPDSGDLQLHVLQSFHDHPISGHYGVNKTLSGIWWEYTWPNICDFVTNYVQSCTTCLGLKLNIINHMVYSDNFLFHSDPGNPSPWTSSWFQGFTAILVVYHFTKQASFILTHDTITSAQLAKLFIIHVFYKHGVSLHVTSDQGSEFVSCFFQSIPKALNMKLHFTLGYHPEGDRQMEHVNQTLEQYLRIYCNYQQDNWHSLLPIAEFCYNITSISTTGYHHSLLTRVTIPHSQFTPNMN